MILGYFFGLYHPCFSYFLGISLDFATLMFQTWINEKDMNHIGSNLKKSQMEGRLMVGGNAKVGCSKKYTNWPLLIPFTTTHYRFFRPRRPSVIIPTHSLLYNSKIASPCNNRYWIYGFRNQFEVVTFFIATSLVLTIELPPLDRRALSAGRGWRPLFKQHF